MNNVPLTVLGIDQSIKSSGFAVLHGENEVIETYLEQYKGIKETDKRSRYLKYGNDVQRLAKEHKPNFVIAEQVRGYHPAVIEVLASLLAITLVALPPGIPVYTVNTSSWKKVMLGDGYGNADKAVSIAIAASLYGKIFSEDESEALLIARFGVLKYQWLLDLTKADRGKARRIA